MLKHALRTLAIVAAALTLTACGGWLPGALEAFGSASTTTVNLADAEKAAKASRLAYVGLLQQANHYAALPRCGQPASPPVCSQQAVVNALRKGDLAADAATEALENGVRTLGTSPTVLAALMAGADASIKAWREITVVYNVK